MGFGGRLESLWEGHRLLTLGSRVNQVLCTQAHNGISAIFIQEVADCIRRLMVFEGIRGPLRRP